MKHFVKKIIYSLGYLLYHSGLFKVIIKLTRYRKKILNYHEISDDNNPFIDGLNIKIPIAAFISQMKFLKQYYNIVSIDTMIGHIENNKKTDREVALTFDDGYKSFINNAFSILKQFNYPATVFIVGKCLNDDYYMWRNKLCFLLNSDFTITTKCMQNYFDHLQVSYKNMFGQFGKNEIIKKSAEIARFMKPPQIEELLSDIVTSIEIPKNELYLNIRDCNILSKEGIEFGNHSYTHFEFNYLNEKEVDCETRSWPPDMTNGINYKHSWLALPRGNPIERNEILGIVKSNGIKCIFCSNGLDNDENTSLYNLGRQHLMSSKEYEIFTEMELLPLFRNIKNMCLRALFFSN